MKCVNGQIISRKNSRKQKETNDMIGSLGHSIADSLKGSKKSMK